MVLKDPIKFYTATSTRVPFITHSESDLICNEKTIIHVETPEGTIHFSGARAHYFACAVTQFQEEFFMWEPQDDEIKQFMTSLAHRLNKNPWDRDEELNSDFLRFIEASKKRRKELGLDADYTAPLSASSLTHESKQDMLLIDRARLQFGISPDREIRLVKNKFGAVTEVVSYEKGFAPKL